MKQIMKSFLSAVILLSTCHLYAALGFNTSLIPRSQSVRSSRELAGQPNFVDPCHPCRTYGTFHVTGWADRTFDPGKVAESLFGKKTLSFSGRSVALRPATDILADYFGLPENYQSTVSFEPRVENLGLDFNFHLGLNRVLEGLYLRVHAPLVHTRWDLKASESITNPDSTQDAAFGYYEGEGAPTTRANLNATVLEAFRGIKNVGDLEALKFGKIDGKQSFTRISDIHIALGWAFICDDDHHMSINFRLGAPSGAKPTAKFLFEPMIGDAGRWNVGGGITAHRILMSNEAEDKHFGLYVDARFTHLLGRAQFRSFDFKNLPGSRYMIIQQLGTTRLASQLGGASNNALGVEYQGGQTGSIALFPAINKTTLKAKISNTLQADVLVKCAYHNNSLTVDFGYELWARTKDELKSRETSAFDANFAFKGDAHVIGHAPAVPANVRLAATQSGATLFKGTNQGLATPSSNPGIDNPVLAVDTLANPVNTSPTSGVQTRSSVEPVLLTDSSIDDDSALNKSMVTHTVFAHLDYEMVREGSECFVPNFGLGLSGEFAHRHLTSKTDDPSFSRGSALSQWSIWFKAGVTF